MKLVAAGASLLFLACFGLPIFVLITGMLWVALGAWAIPVYVFLLFMTVVAVVNEVEKAKHEAK